MISLPHLVLKLFPVPQLGPGISNANSFLVEHPVVSSVPPLVRKTCVQVGLPGGSTLFVSEELRYGGDPTSPVLRSEHAAILTDPKGVIISLPKRSASDLFALVEHSFQSGLRSSL